MGLKPMWGGWCCKGFVSPLPGSKPASPPGPPVYVDLAYVPGSWSARTVDEEFFRRVRSLCYVISGDDHVKEGVMRPILDALLAGKQQWGSDVQVRPPARCLGEGKGPYPVVQQGLEALPSGS